jgi:hypothetical protein
MLLRNTSAVVRRYRRRLSGAELRADRQFAAAGVRRSSDGGAAAGRGEAAEPDFRSAVIRIEQFVTAAQENN